MNLTYTFGFILFLVLIRNSIHESVDNDYEESGDYYDVDDYQEYDLKQEEAHTSTTTTTTTALPSTVTRQTTTNFPEVTAGVFLDMPTIQLLNCPKNCQCNGDFTIANCSNQNFEHVPSDLPQTIEKLILSFNRISKLDDRNFENFTNLRELILDNNHLTTVDFREISNLNQLEYLSLVNNQIKKIDPNAFSKLLALNKLDLSQNSIELTASDYNSFLNQPMLKELNLSSCNLQSLSDDVFRNLSGLTTLDLENNKMDEEINTKAFEPMQKLTKLKLPELKQNSIIQLCKILTAIDVITFPRFDVSCFELEAGSSFDESTIPAKSLGDMTDSTNRKDEDNVKTDTATENNAANNKPSSSGSAGGEKSINTGEQENRRKKISQTHSNMNRNGTMFANNTTTTVAPESTTLVAPEDDYQVAISTQTINYILIGIIVVAVTGIIIGIICRRDICGIKTKMCRTRRPPPTDQVRPAEEIPLNKVEVVR